MIEISYFENFGDNGSSINLPDLLNSIKNGDFKESVEEIRRFKKEGKEYSELKSKLPQFTPSVLFSPSRKKENLIMYNPMVVLDIDHVGFEAMEIRERAALNEFTYCAFLSPSGSGVKIFIKTNSTPENHEKAFNQIAKYYEGITGAKIDQSGKDIPRACFVSYDPDLYLNEKASIFSAATSTPIVEFSTATVSSNNIRLFKDVLYFTQNIDQYRIGNRNNFIYTLANNLNRAGLNQDEAEKRILSEFSDPDITSEIPTAVKSAYRHIEEHGIFGARYYSSASFESFATTTNRLTEHDTPLIPDYVFSNLPDFLKECTSVFEVPRERDIFLTGALSILSGCFNNVSGKYDGRLFSPNLFSFVIAPPASGKGVLIYARNLAKAIHEELRNEEDQLTLSTISQESRLKWFFIPGDSSSAAIKRLLILNSEQGTICETEADTLSGALAQDWGSFDDLLRKAFQHEPVSFSRIGTDDDVNYKEINRPKLSICLTGTPNQVITLIKSTENGLFSRIIFYCFKNEDVPHFKDVFADSSLTSLDDFFAEKADRLKKMYKCSQKIGPCNFTLTSDQKEIFQRQFDIRVKRLHDQYGEETHAIVFRLGLITFRIAMLLSIIRNLDEGSLCEFIECMNEDFEISMLLTACYLEHSMAIFRTMPNTTSHNVNSIILLRYLPDKFTFTEAEKIGKVFNDISSRSVSNYLKDLVDSKLLIQTQKNGPYTKPEMQ